jgi:20S proteasome subunit alpha 5
MTRSEYDRGVNTFSPEGRLIQVEYAIEAVKHGSTVIGIETAEGVVLAVEKRLTSPLLEPKSIEKIMEVDEHVGCAMSGLTADARTLIDRARVECMQHRFTYGEPMDVHSITQSLCDVALRFGEEGDDDEDRMSRPFGVALLMAGMSGGEPALYHMDPSGTYVRFKARAIGSASEGAQSQLQEKYNASMTLTEAIDLAMQVLKQVMEEKLTGQNVEMSTVAKETEKFKMFTPEEIEAVIERIPEADLV